MASDLSIIVQSLQGFDRRLRLNVREEFASIHDQHRVKIRTSLVAEFGNEALLNLAQFPKHENWSISISHCRAAGGWLAAPKPLKVGFDLEVYDRIRKEAVARIAGPDELNEAPDPACLWCAKEAYFKALGSDQPGTFSQVRVLGWRQNGAGQWLFNGGIVLQEGTLLAAACII